MGLCAPTLRIDRTIALQNHTLAKPLMSWHLPEIISVLLRSQHPCVCAHAGLSISSLEPFNGMRDWT